MNQPLAKRLLRLLATALLVFLLLYFVPMGNIFEQVKTAHLPTILLCIALAFAMMLVQAIRWKVLLPLEEKPPLADFFRYIAIGYFANLFLPGSLGGDALKSLAFGKKHGGVTASLGAVATGRFLGFSWQLIFFWFALFINPLELGREVVGSMCLLSMLVALTWFSFFTRSEWRWESPSLPAKGLNKALDALAFYHSHPRSLLLGIFWSLAFQVLGTLCAYYSYLAVSAPITLHSAFLFFPVIYVVTAMPITIMSIGIKEGINIYLFTSMTGVTAAKCISANVVGYFFTILQALFGGMLLFFTRRKEKPDSPHQP